MPSTRRKVVEVTVKVISKKPILPKGQSDGLASRRPISEHLIQRRKPLAQQRMEADLEREIERIKKEQEKQ